ncbi:MAG: hypothetical protein P8J59_08560 [Phycisphaerales bacterium]|nr:hypothetical protein [Phycisphaerales bacterium]
MISSSSKTQTWWARRFLFPSLALAIAGLLYLTSDSSEAWKGEVRSATTRLLSGTDSASGDRDTGSGFSLEPMARAAIDDLQPPRSIESIKVRSDHLGETATATVVGDGGRRVVLGWAERPPRLRDVRRDPRGLESSTELDSGNDS